MILPKVRDPRFITVRRGGSLQDDDHRLLAVWAADCAEHVLHHFEQARPGDDRPRRAIDLGRAWARGEITWREARTAAGHANAAARDLSGAARHAAYAAGQAAAVGHVAAHELGAAAYAIRAARAAAPKARARRLVAGSASGSAPSFPTRSENSCSTTSGCATSCAGSRSTADAARSQRPTRGQVRATHRPSVATGSLTEPRLPCTPGAARWPRQPPRRRPAVGVALRR